MNLRHVAVTVLIGLAGCLAPNPALVPDDELEWSVLPADFVPPFDAEHDHTDPALHAFAAGLEPLGYHNLAPGSDGTQAADRGNWINSEIIVRGSHAFLGYVGGGHLVSILDISNASRPRLLGTYDTGNAWAVDVAVSDDGNWIFVCVYSSATGTYFTPDYLLQAHDAPTGVAAPSVTVIDARDKARPVLSSVLPVHGLGPHTAVYHRYPDGREVLFVNKGDPSPGNVILVADIVPSATGGRVLEPRTTISLDAVGMNNIPHDVDVAEHPLTGQTVLYAAWWDAGLVTVDVSDPAEPEVLAHFTAFAPDDVVQLHDVHPFPRLVGDRHYSIATPEIPAGPTTGPLRVFDTTDPREPRLVGTWTLPGSFGVDRSFNFSPHNFQFLPDGRVALGHGHAGVWIVDWLGPGGPAAPDPAFLEAPRAAAFFVPHAEGARPPAWSPVFGAPWVWGTAVDERGVLWVADSASGLYALAAGR